MIIKTFILSQICYTARCFRPSYDTLTKLEDLICNFINYSRDHFSRANIFKPMENFGLGIPSLVSFCMSLLQKNCSRAISNNQPWADILKSNFKFNLLDRVRIEKTGSIYMDDIAHAINELAIRYYN